MFSPPGPGYKSVSGQPHVQAVLRARHSMHPRWGVWDCIGIGGLTARTSLSGGLGEDSSICDYVLVF